MEQVTEMGIMRGSVVGMVGPPARASDEGGGRGWTRSGLIALVDTGITRGVVLLVPTLHLGDVAQRDALVVQEAACLSCEEDRRAARTIREQRGGSDLVLPTVVARIETEMDKHKQGRRATCPIQS